MTISRCDGLTIGFLVISLGGCGRETVSDKALCAPLSDIQPLANPTTSLQFTDQAERCVRRTSYKLSAAQGSNGEVADAAVLRCKDEIGAIAVSYHKSVDMPSTAQIEQMSASTEVNTEEYKKLARMWVIESRAGRCDKVLEAQ